MKTLDLATMAVEKPILTFVPAYGVQYPDVKEAVEAWNSGKDFRAFPGGFYLSKRDVKNAPELYSEGWMHIPNLKVRLQIW